MDRDPGQGLNQDHHPKMKEAAPYVLFLPLLQAFELFSHGSKKAKYKFHIK